MTTTHDALTSRALSTAAALLTAASEGDRFAMRRLLRLTAEPGTDDALGDILRACSAHYHVGIDQILGDARQSEVSKARMAACYVAHLRGYSYSHIGRKFGRDHSTVMHAVSRVSSDATWRTEVEALAERTGWEAA